MAGKLGYGATLACGANAAAVTATVTLGELTALPPPPHTRETIDVTSMSSPNATREFILGLADAGEVSFELNWVPGDATDLEFIEMQTETDARLFVITFTQVTPNRSYTFRGLLTNYEPSVPVDDKMTASVTLKVTGAVTIADAA